jgi:hypothetical protein
MKSSTEDVCATTLNNEQTPPTAFRHTIERHPVQWLALCNKFWDYQETVQNPDEGTDIERFTTRDSVLLHECGYIRLSGDQATLTDYSNAYALSTPTSMGRRY